MNGGYAVNKSILSFLAILVLILFSAPVRANCTPGNGWVSFVYNSFPQGSHSVSASDPVGTVIATSGLVNSSWGAANIVSLTCPFGSTRTWNMTGLTTFTTIGGKQVYDTGLAGVGVYIYATRGDGTVMEPFPVIQTFSGPVTSGNTAPRLQIELIKTNTVVNGGTLNLSTIYREYATSGTTSAQFNMTTVNLNNVTIVASACSLNNGSPLVVPLGTHSVTAFTGVGSTTGQRNINLNLTGCPASTATIKFMGDSQTGATDLLQLTPGSTPGSHIAIALYENDGTPLPINTASSTPHTLTGTNNITYKAAYKQHTAGTVPIGVAPGTATLDIQYN